MTKIILNPCNLLVFNKTSVSRVYYLVNVYCPTFTVPFSTSLDNNHTENEGKRCANEIGWRAKRVARRREYKDDFTELTNPDVPFLHC